MLSKNKKTINKVFFKLKEHGLVQQVVIKTLITKQYFIHELAELIDVPFTKISEVLNGIGTLEKEPALKLIRLFYKRTL